jgi:hypothetical protein
MQLYEPGNDSHMHGQMQVQEVGEVDPTNLYLFVLNFYHKRMPLARIF